MNDALLVRGLECFGDLSRDLECLLNGERPSLASAAL